MATAISTAASRPADIDFTPDGLTARCTGMWTVNAIAGLEQRLRRRSWPKARVRFDGSGVERLDTAGAWVLIRALQDVEAAGGAAELTGFRPEIVALLELVRAHAADARQVPHLPRQGTLERMGRSAWRRGEEAFGFVAFVGEVAATAGGALLRPARVRVRLALASIQTAGLNALPLLGLLSFLLGVVIAYQGGVQLGYYGANIYIADLVGLSMLRELAPLMTAIIVAGRTGSAFTAEIGTMTVTEEVDALRTLAISPLEVLVLPKILALVIALPLLTVYSDAMGVIGGMVMADFQLGVGPVAFLTRFENAVSLPSYLIGVGKAPVFALIIALVGCYQGFRVTGSAASVGRKTTVSVVQSIFLIIVVDAAFSVVFSWLGI